MEVFVTIGICARNSEKTIKETINSIIKQDFSYDLMEVIFVNDGSTDKTLELIKEYVRNIPIKYKLFSTEWKGLGAARKLITNNAKGKYILWVDSDQVLTKNFVRKQFEFMELNTDVGIAKGMVREPPNANYVLFLELLPHIIMYSRMSKWSTFKNLPGTGASIYRIEAINNVGGFDERITGDGEDQDIAYRIMKNGWSICRTSSLFYEKHNNMSKWRDIWNMYFWRGTTSGRLYLLGKHQFSLPKMTPLVGLMLGIQDSITAYKMFCRKIVFLLPLLFVFKMTTWSFGFYLNLIQSQLLKFRYFLNNNITLK